MTSLMLNAKSFISLICCCFLFLTMQVLMGQIDPLPESDCPATFCPEGECLDTEAPIGTDPCIPRPSEQDCCGNVIGCGDICAMNYNPSATFTDGSCLYLSFEVFWPPTNLGTFNSCIDVLPVAPMDEPTFIAQGGNINAGPCAIIIVESIDDPAMDNCINATINRMTTIWDDAKNPNGVLDADEESFSRLFNFSILTNERQACDDGDPCTENDLEVVCGATVCIPCAGTTVISGCIDILACNFDPNAGCDDGSCEFGDSNCLDPCNIINGCIDPNACNYDITATCDDGSCELGDLNCPDPCNVVLGCINPSACNYNATATCDDGSCSICEANGGKF